MMPITPATAGSPIETRDRRRLRGDRARAAILARATDIASEGGLEKLSFGQVAAASRVPKSNVQTLFATKEALQLATIEHGVAIYFDAVVRPALLEPTPVTRLTALVAGWFDFVERRTLPGGCLIHALASEYRTRPGAIRDRIAAHRADANKRLADLVIEAQAAGEIIGGADANLIAFDFIAYQATANVAALMCDGAQFDLARRASQACLDALLVRQ